MNDLLNLSTRRLKFAIPMLVFFLAKMAKHTLSQSCKSWVSKYKFKTCYHPVIMARNFPLVVMQVLALFRVDPIMYCKQLSSAYFDCRDD